MSYEATTPARRIRIPKSSARRTPNVFAKLITRVKSSPALGGFAFEGIFVLPGSEIPPESIWPDRIERPALLLEYAGAARTAADGRSPRGHNRAPGLYILWRWDPLAAAWMEAARSQAASWEWAADLAPIAERLLRQFSPVEVLPSLSQVAVRIAAALDRELRAFDPVDRGLVLGVIHDQLAARIAQSGLGAAAAPPLL